MTDLPRLTVTRVQADLVVEHVLLWGLDPLDSRGRIEAITLRLPERPTMPCPVGLRLRGGGIGGQMMTECPTCGAVMPSTAGPHPRGVAVPIPEGTRVEVGWWEHGEDTMGFWMKWHSVAIATLSEIKSKSRYVLEKTMSGETQTHGINAKVWIITLTNIETIDD